MSFCTQFPTSAFLEKGLCIHITLRNTSTGENTGLLLLRGINCKAWILQTKQSKKRLSMYLIDLNPFPFFLEHQILLLLNARLADDFTRLYPHKILLHCSLHTINLYQPCEMEWSDQGLHIYCLAVPFNALHFRGRIKRQSQQITASEWSLIIVCFATGAQTNCYFLDLELS